MTSWSTGTSAANANATRRCSPDSLSRDETFEFVVRQGAEGNVGAAAKVPLQEDELLVCDVLRSHGQTQIQAGDIDTSRRQAFIFATGNAVQIVSGLWSVLAPATETVQSALDSADAVLDGHFDGTANKHPAAHVTYTPHGFVGASNVQAAIDEVVDDLSSATAGTPGASKVGADAVAGTPNALPAGNVDGQLSQLLAWLNSHVGAATGAHAASAISVADSGANLNAANVETALAEILDAFEDDHYRGNETNAGQHRAIHQPNFGTGKVLLWEAIGVGSAATHFRVYADSDSMWFVLNASWNGSAWARDSTSWFCSGFRFSRQEFEVLHEDAFAATFTTWNRTWLLSYRGASNSTFVTSGAITETGRLGMEGTNTYNASRTMALGGGVTFRSRFPAAPSSITLAVSTASSSWSGTATVYEIDQDGFAFFSYQSGVGSMSTIWWFGSYTAVA